MDWDHREKPSGREVSGTNPGELKLHSLIDLDHCHRCLDKGVYLGNELVGAITRQGKRWHVWRGISEISTMQGNTSGDRSVTWSSGNWNCEKQGKRNRQQREE